MLQYICGASSSSFRCVRTYSSSPHALFPSFSVSLHRQGCSRACVCKWTWSLQLQFVVLVQSEVHSRGIELSAGSQQQRPRLQTNIILIELNIDPRIQIVRRPNGCASLAKAAWMRPGSILQHLTQTWRTCATLLCSSERSYCEGDEVCHQIN